MQDKKDYKLLLSLIIWSLLPSIYMLIRMNIVSINSVDINILGQMEWFDLIDEIITTTLTVPLYFLLKKGKSSKNKNGFAFGVSFLIYCIFTVLIAFKVGSISKFMNASYATEYLFLQSFSMLFMFIGTFMILLFTLNDDYKTIFILLISKVILLSLFDYLFIGQFKDIGASYSEILVYFAIAIISLTISFKRDYIGFGKCELAWTKEWIKVGIFSGVQIFLDNFIYAIMICKMVNAVSESGNYWVANNFIWGWLLVPVTCIAEIIKKNNLEKLTMKNTWRYGIAIILLWLVTFPFWEYFIDNVMTVNSSTVLNIVLPIIPFYITYIFSSFLDAWFISKGKTIYLMIISAIVNIVYYGIIYTFFNNGAFNMDIMFIIFMFGGGMLVHFILSIFFYAFEIVKIGKLKEI